MPEIYHFTNFRLFVGIQEIASAITGETIHDPMAQKDRFTQRFQGMVFPRSNEGRLSLLENFSVY